MSEVEALKSLGAFPLVQAALFVMTVLAGIWVFLRGSKDAKNASLVPPWMLIGPVADLINSVRAIAEQGRATNHILERIEAETKNIAKDHREQTMLLEDIRNNQVQRGDITPSPVRRK